MTRHQKRLIQLVDALNARSDTPGVSVSRAVGRLQRDDDLGFRDCLRLVAFGLGYVKARTGVDEPCTFDLDAELGDEHATLRTKGEKAGA